MKKIIAIVLVLVLVISIAGCSNDNKANETTDQTVAITEENPVVAQVDDEIIDLETFNKAFAMLEMSYIKQYGEGVLERDVNGKKLKDILKRELLNSLIDEIVLRDHMTKEGFSVSEEEVDSKLTEFKNYIGGDAAQGDIFTKENISDDFIKERIKMQMYLIAFHDRIQAEVESKIDLESPEKQKEIVKIDAQHILLKTLEEANQVIERLEEGEEFAALAQELSQDPGSAESGGSLGSFGRGVMVKPFEKVAFSLKAGEISEPVETQFGFHVIKVNQVITIGDLKETEEGVAELAEIRSKLAENDFIEAFESQLDALRKEHKIEQFDDRIIESTGEQKPTETETTAK